MQIYSNKCGICFILSCIAICGCDQKTDWSTDPPSPQKIAATDKVRKDLGIREIKEGWSFYGRQFGAENWKADGRICKVVCYDDKYDTILWETDLYYSGRRIQTSDPDAGLVDEMLNLCYDYRSGRFRLVVSTDSDQMKEWEYALRETTVQDSGTGKVSPPNEETLAVADKILTVWGLNRL